MRALIALSLLLCKTAISAPISPPEISQGVRVLYGNFVDYEKNEPRAFFVPQQLEVLDVKDTKASIRGLQLSTPEDVIKFFSGLPVATQKKGLWLTNMNVGISTKAQEEHIAQLSHTAMVNGITLFVCLPQRSVNQKSSFVAWKCEKFSPERDGAAVVCEPTISLDPSGSLHWSCAWLK